ncbi:hypothetical protein RRG08_004665 [Elysia crispata]|nr:hypothetical protein RRG08_020718 [Elysia crispata]KAK3772822.1 hypothetical protein RRG08_004665 [Elysia crispata]
MLSPVARLGASDASVGRTLECSLSDQEFSRLISPDPTVSIICRSLAPRMIDNDDSALSTSSNVGGL